MKIALTPQECILPETAIILQMTVPTGSSEFTADEVLPGFNFLYGWDINDRLVDRCFYADESSRRRRDGRFLRRVCAVVDRWSRRGPTASAATRNGIVLVPCSADTNHTENYFNGGFTVLLNDDVQWDVRAGVGLNEAADDYFVGTGLSITIQVRRVRTSLCAP